MNQENLDYLKNGIKYMGFDEQLSIELAKQMKDQVSEITLKTQKAYGQDGNDKMDAILHFKKSAEGDMYFFNSYSASIKKDGHILEQTFYVNKNKGVTSKEAFNLLEGRSVNKDLLNKDGEKYNAWMKLNFSETDAHGNYKVNQFHSEKYGKDGIQLDVIVSQHPIKELGDPDTKEKLMKSLQKGNLQAVTFVKDGNEQKMFVAANPQYKSLDVYDSSMKKVRTEHTNKQQENREAPAAGESQKKGNSKKQDKSEVKALLPQKNTGKTRGAGLKQ